MSKLSFGYETLDRTGHLNVGEVPQLPDDRSGLKKKEIAADHPTWCPGCGDFSVLALYFKLIEKRKIWHEKVTTVAGIGCSSRFPYFVQAHGTHYIHGRALPYASGVSLSRPDLHVFVFGGDGDAFSIGGNHFNHTARKNVKLTYVVMDNWVYGLTKKQTSPTSPLGFKSKTDQWGAVDLCCPDYAHKSQASLAGDGSRDGSRWIQFHPVPERVH